MCGSNFPPRSPHSGPPQGLVGEVVWQPLLKFADEVLSAVASHIRAVIAEITATGNRISDTGVIGGGGGRFGGGPAGRPGKRLQRELNNRTSSKRRRIGESYSSHGCRSSADARRIKNHWPEHVDRVDLFIAATNDDEANISENRRRLPKPAAAQKVCVLH